MKSEKGITLIELLGVLVIISILFTLAGSILTNSIKTSNSATMEQRMQQEANYITEAIRNKYLEEATGELKVEIDGNQLKLNGDIISEGYEYCLDLDEKECTKQEVKINRSETHHIFQLKLSSKDRQHTHKINTKYSKLK